MGTEIAPEALVIFNQLTQLTVQDFIKKKKSLQYLMSNDLLDCFQKAY
jgi:archaellum biogenesis ATPase FlaH